MESNGSKFKEFLLSGLGKATMISLFYIIIFGIIMIAANNDIGILIFIIFLASTYFGWQALNKIQPDIFLIMPIIGWVIFIVVKGVLSFLIGIFVAPFQIAKKIANAIQNTH